MRAETLHKARVHGAELIVDSARSDPREPVMEWTAGLGVDVVLEGVGVDSTFSWSLRGLKRGETLVLVGHDPQHPITVDTKEMHYNEWRIAGTWASTKQDLLELIALTERGQLKPLVAAVMPLEQVNAGLAELQRGERVGRIVIQVG